VLNFAVRALNPRKGAPSTQWIGRWVDSIADTSLFAYVTTVLNFAIEYFISGLKEADKSEEEITFTLANMQI
jgi:hypothetical protein